MPGWGIKSWGYHGDDGQFHTYPQKRNDYGPKYGNGDIIGCGFDQGTGTVFFAKNGERLGMKEIRLADELIAVIGTRGKGASFTVNFGQKQFVYKDAEAFMDGIDVP
ncbi:MAG: hypothetical protein MMC33_001535 [Icmadophila ericetorum]|nr:hypothetical protein [Icmadophila ericetorum]